MPNPMSEDLKQEILSNIRGAVAIITARGYSPDSWAGSRVGVNVRRAVGLSALNYETHLATLGAIGRRLPPGARGRLFTGISDWETYKSRSQKEVLDMLKDVIATLEQT